MSYNLATLIKKKLKKKNIQNEIIFFFLLFKAVYFDLQNPYLMSFSGLDRY